MPCFLLCRWPSSSSPSSSFLFPSVGSLGGLGEMVWVTEGLGTLRLVCQGIFLLDCNDEVFSLSVSVFHSHLAAVLAGVIVGDPLPEGQLVGPLPQGMTTHTVFASPDWATCAQSNERLTHLSNTLPQWLGGGQDIYSLCDLNESLEIGSKNGYSNKAAEGICKHGGILCSSALLSSNGHTVIRIIVRTDFELYLPNYYWT